MRVEDFYVRFDQFIDQVLRAEELETFKCNIFQNEVQSPTDYYILRYPYVNPATNRSELLARLGIMTDAVITKDVYGVLIANPRVRLMVSTGKTKAMAFQTGCNIKFTYVPKMSFADPTMYKKIADEFIDSIPYSIYVEISGMSNIPPIRDFMAGVTHRNIEAFVKSVTNQIQDPECKVVWLGVSDPE